MRQSGLLLNDNRDVSEACVTRPLVEIRDNCLGCGGVHVSFFSFGSKLLPGFRELCMIVRQPNFF